MHMHSKFVKDLSDKTQISIRQIEAEWKIAQKQLNFDILMEPEKYSRLKVLDGTMAEEIGRRVEANVANPQSAGEETKEVLGFEEDPVVEVPEIPSIEPEISEMPEMGLPGEEFPGVTETPSSEEETPEEEFPEV